MSSKARAPSGPPAPSVPLGPNIQRVLPVPDAETAQRAPMAINGVRVLGGVDSLVVEFYYIDDVKVALVANGAERPNPPATRLLNDGTLLVESRAVARVSLPVGVVIDLVVQSIAAGANSFPRLKTQFEEAMAKIQEVGATVAPFFASFNKK